MDNRVVQNFFTYLFYQNPAKANSLSDDRLRRTGDKSHRRDRGVEMSPLKYFAYNDIMHMFDMFFDESDT